MPCNPNDTKCLLIEKALKEPLRFTNNDVKQLIELITFDDTREMLKRMYNMTEEILKTDSDASTGILGQQNQKSTQKRHKLYHKKIKDKIRYKPDGKIIVAEGDSWFQFPRTITDIIDWLNKEDNLAIYSIAYGGDWYANIIYEEKYISELTIHKPDVFMISGSGNDLVGGHRLAVMVDREANYPKYNSIEEMSHIIDVGTNVKQAVLGAQKFIAKEFYAFINILKLQYYLMFNNLLKKSTDFKDMLIITQGYDYPFPRYDKASWFDPVRRIVNNLTGTGKWLKRPLDIKGIPEDKHRAVLQLMMMEFNEMFKWIAGEYHEQVVHIDCRGVAPEEKNWYDELHLKSSYFKKVARKGYLELIKNQQNQIWRTQHIKKGVYRPGW